MLLSEICSLANVVRTHSVSDDLLVVDVTDDSRKSTFGCLFCARPTANETGKDGLRYCKGAVEAGAHAIAVPEGTLLEDIHSQLTPYQASLIAVMWVRDLGRFYALVASLLYPERPRFIAGITGTNGKTSTTSFTVDLWRSFGLRAASFGTLGVRGMPSVATKTEDTLTTIDPKSLHLALRQLSAQHDTSHVAMEVTSHALDQGRVDGIQFNASAFTNFTQDHLDYHGTMGAYLSAKCRLFRELTSPTGCMVFNADDLYLSKITGQFNYSNMDVIRVGLDKSKKLDICGSNARRDGLGQVLKIEIFGRSQEVRLPVLGQFQIYNFMLAVALCISSGKSPDSILQNINFISSVPGRMDYVGSTPSGGDVYVDYAHTPDALECVLSAAKSMLNDGSSLAVVFGCGGNRDNDKRPKMAEAACKWADRIYATADNPRIEPLEQIISDIEGGMRGRGTLIYDRPSAIKQAVCELSRGDILIIAGKGHEDYQIIPIDNIENANIDRLNISNVKNYTIKVPMDDAKIAMQVIDDLNL